MRLSSPFSQQLHKQLHKQRQPLSINHHHHHHHHRRRPSPPPTSAHLRTFSFHHRPAGLLFEHAADALDNGRFAEAAAILEEALIPPTYAHTRVQTLPPHWSLLQLQTNLLECLLHARDYQRAIAVARRLRTVLPRRSWAKLLWIESIALARMGLFDMARDVYSSAFMGEQPCVPAEYHATMHTSLLIALGAVEATTRMPTPPDMHRGNAACDPAYPFVTVCDDSVVVDSWGCNEEGVWSRDACVRYMLFGNPHAAL